MSKEGNSLTLQWSIENFSFWEPGFQRRTIISPLFVSRFLEGGGCNLNMYPRGHDKEDRHLRVSLVLWDLAHLVADCELTFLDGDGRSLATGRTRNTMASASATLDLIPCPTVEEVFETRTSYFAYHDTLKIRCRLWRSSEGEVENEFISARTRIEVREEAFLWRIERFSNLPLDRQLVHPVDLNYFPVVKGDFNVNLWLTSASIEEASVDIQIATKTMEELAIKCKISVLDKDMKAVKCVEEKHLCSKLGITQICKAAKFALRRELLEGGTECLVDDVLTLVCEFVFSKGLSSGIIERIFRGPANLM